MRKISFIVGVFLLIIVTIWALTNDSGVGNPTAGDILDGNENADILKLDGLIYMNVSDTAEQPKITGEKIGEVKGQSSTSWWFWNLYATKLPEGAEVFTKEGVTYNKGDAPFTVLVKDDEEIHVYHALVEG